LELANRFPELAPPDFAERDPSRSIDNTKYTTLAGDSLFEISRQQLGQASRYLELLELNRSQLPPGVNHLTRLPAGIELNLPH
jgi:nucleoid-associated protein YgaU